MYNRQLDTFVRVCETGSFSAAAESLFITPSAVIQQINALEGELGVKLFTRSRKGVALTEAGRYLKTEAADYIRKGTGIQARLREIAAGGTTLHVGTTFEYKVRLLYELWVLYSSRVEPCRINLSQLLPDCSNAGEADMIEGIRSALAWQQDFEFKKLFTIPTGFTVSRHHPLRDRASLTLEDIKPYRLLISEQLISGGFPALRSRLEQSGIHYELCSGYPPDLIWRASAENHVLLCPLVWSDIMFDVTIIPNDLQYTVDYGIFYKTHSMKSVEKFISFIGGVYDGSIDCPTVPVF